MISTTGRKWYSSNSMPCGMFPPTPQQQQQQESSMKRCSFSTTGGEELEELEFFDQLYEKSNIQETNELVAVKMIEIERAIDIVEPSDLKDAYFAAVMQEIKQGTHYVRSREFLIAFLRADNFNANKAALRLARFFKFKLELFGLEKLPHPITEQDLNSDDLKVLGAGSPYFAGVDCGGRSLIVYQRQKLKKSGLLRERYAKSIWRVGFFQVMRAVESNRNICQQKGFVIIRWSFNLTQSVNDYRLMYRNNIRMFLDILPINIVGVHDCSDNSITSACFAWSRRVLLSQDRRNIVRVHTGTTATQCLSELSKYGIDVDSLRIDTSSPNENMDGSESSLNSREIEEEATPNVHSGNALPMDVNIMDHHDAKTTTTTHTTPVPPNFHLPTTQTSSDDVWNEMNLVSLESRIAPAPFKHTSADHLMIDGIGSSRSSSTTCNTVSAPPFSSPTTSLQNLTDSKCNHKTTTKTTTKTKKSNNRSSSRKTTHKNSCSAGTGAAADGDHLPMKLYEVLESNQFPTATWWSRGGNSFVIHKKNFGKLVLVKSFDGVMFNSFLRKLRRWGFRRVLTKGGKSSNILEYRHHLFQKNSPHLMKDWNMNDDFNLPPSKKEKLPVTLRKILDETNGNGNKDDDSDNAIWWVCDNKAFALDNNKFSESLLDRYFVGVKLVSFYRMMSRWGFKRLYDEEGCIADNEDGNIRIYQHKLFQKNIMLSSELLENWAHLDGLAQISTPAGESFVKKLLKLLESMERQHAGIWWEDTGTSFAIQTQHFSRDVLPQEYNGVSLYSFLRSLKRWGFEKLKSKSGSHTLRFQHPYIQKNNTALPAHVGSSNKEETTSSSLPTCTTSAREMVLANLRNHKNNKSNNNEDSGDIVTTSNAIDTSSTINDEFMRKDGQPLPLHTFSSSDPNINKNLSCHLEHNNWQTL